MARSQVLRIPTARSVSHVEVLSYKIPNRFWLFKGKYIFLVDVGRGATIYFLAIRWMWIATTKPQ